MMHHCCIISVQLRGDSEHIENIPDRMHWEEYRQKWILRWGLRSTNIIAPTTQVLYTALVLEVRRQGQPNILNPVITQASRLANEASQSLTELFHDTDLIWQIESEEKYHKYFCLNRPRTLSQWPEQNEEIIFPETCYNYHEYTGLWWKFLYQEDICFLKFGCVNSSTRGHPPSWLQDWWKDFGINKEETDPNILSVFAPMYYVRDLNFQGPNAPELLQIY